MRSLSVPVFTVQDMFVLIIFVAAASLLLNYHISSYNIIISNPSFHVNNHPENDPAAGRVSGSKFSAFGRSLRQHAPDNGSDVDGNSRLNVAARLTKIEEQLRLLSKTPIIVVTDGAGRVDDTLPVAKSKFHIKHTKLDDALRWLDDGTVVQGNWSVILCPGTGRCPDAIHRYGTEKVNRIPALSKYLDSPTAACRIGREINKMHGKRREACTEKDVTVETRARGYRSPSITYNTTSIQYIREGVYQVSWHLQQHPLTFPAGPLLRLQCLVTSLSPLRLYVYPMMESGPYSATAHIREFQQTSIEQLLQHLSETYGLGSSSKWWESLQYLLIHYMITIELELRKSAVIGCSRCFQFFYVDLVCDSINTCFILQLLRASTVSVDVLDNTLALVSSTTTTYDDLTQRLLVADLGTVCPDSGRERGCLTDADLTYLLDNERETEAASDWIKVYPTPAGCTYTHLMHTLPRNLEHGHQIGVSRSTPSMHDTLRKMGYFHHVSDQEHRDSEPITEENRLCSKEPSVQKQIGAIETSPSLEFEELSSTHYTTSVGYHLILIRVWARAKHCDCEVRIGNQYNSPGPKNITLGLGENNIHLIIVNRTHPDPVVIVMITLTIHRRTRERTGNINMQLTSLKMCSLKQDCSLIYDPDVGCGLVDAYEDMRSGRAYPGVRCRSGDQPGHWKIPCGSCHDDESCYWQHATWQPEHCHYKEHSPASLRRCFTGKTLLFIGDSTNRGMLNYFLEQVNGSLWTWDKTHSSRMYTHLNNNNTRVTFAYYPHFWLPRNHRPKFHKVLYQLIKRSLPLENNANTVLVVGGVHWLAKQHIDIIIEALKMKGLSNITVVVKGLGAGFHQPVDGLRYVPPEDHPALLQRESDILQHSKQRGFRVVATFNMTMARYKDFHEGDCACHFHKVERISTRADGLSSTRGQYSITGEINAAYSQMMADQLCS